MDLEEIKDEYRARVEPRGRSISEILEEAAKETKAYKKLEEENKDLHKQLEIMKNEAMKDMRYINKLEKEKYDLEQKVKEQYYEIQQYEKGFANGSWHGDDEY